MYLAIDIGGTKTLLALFSKRGRLENSFRFPTPTSYIQFKGRLQSALPHLGQYELAAAACAVPARIDHAHGGAFGYGTLAWQPAPIKQDLEKLLNCHVLVENDAKLAGLSEALLVLRKYRRVLYVTIGTGIGTAVLMDGRIDKALADTEGGQIWLERDGQRIQWEDVVSGRAIVERFGKEAQSIDDPHVWQLIATDIADGLTDLIAVIQPQVVIIGGGIGAHFHKFGTRLNSILSSRATDLVPMPPVIKAQRPEEAVIYGCYDFVSQKHL